MQSQDSPGAFRSRGGSFATARRPSHPGFPPIQGYGRARRSAGRPGGGRALGILAAITIATVTFLDAACSGGGGGGGNGNPFVPPPPASGSVEVTTATTGVDLDPDGYDVVLDGATRKIGINDATVFDQLDPGSRQVSLSGIQGGCAVQGDNPRSVTVVAGEMARTTFQIECAAPAPIPVLSFAAIAGEWSGIVTETQPCCVFVYRLTYTLGTEAPAGGQIGTYVVSEAAPFHAEGRLMAAHASGNAYGVDEIVTTATGWVNAYGVQLTHDPVAGTLAYKWNNPLRPGYGATGVLERVE